jgi:acetylornithine/succinyldiaminopimelate/putrescine aminotransferase
MPDALTFPPCAAVLGTEAADAMARGRDFLAARASAELLGLVGTIVPELAMPDSAADKRTFPASYGGGKPCGDDLLAGLGVFYISQAGKVMLDCVSGHYQMTWGYNPPQLMAALSEAADLGIVWDNHANTPSLPVKMLADELASAGAAMGLDRVLLGVCTGSVACSTALKVMLARYFHDQARTASGPPVVVVLDGNYHGTDVLAQKMRGMWPGLDVGMETVAVQPNEPDALRAAFAQYGRRVAGFWAEPVMMNREAILVEPAFLATARDLCDECGALMAIDEIQTGFWYPEVLMMLRQGVAPDLLVVGKGMTAGFHPLAGLLYRRELDILEQYDAISTNGGASMAAYLALCNMRLIENDRERMATLALKHYDGLSGLAGEFPDLIQETNGDGFLSGLKFKDREDALGFHKAAVERGLWVRAHAYHPGHRTVLMKYALAVDEQVIEFVLETFRSLLSAMPWR